MKSCKYASPLALGSRCPPLHLAKKSVSHWPAHATESLLLSTGQGQKCCQAHAHSTALAPSPGLGPSLLTAPKSSTL